MTSFQRCCRPFSLFSMRKQRAEWESQRRSLVDIHNRGDLAKNMDPDGTTSTPRRGADDERNKQPSLRIVCAGAVLFGTLSIVCVKATFNTTCADGRKFNAPFLMCLVVAAAMATPLVAVTAYHHLRAALHCDNNFDDGADQALLVEAPAPAAPTTVSQPMRRFLRLECNECNDGSPLQRGKLE